MTFITILCSMTFGAIADEGPARDPASVKIEAVEAEYDELLAKTRVELGLASAPGERALASEDEEKSTED